MRRIRTILALAAVAIVAMATATSAIAAPASDARAAAKPTKNLVETAVAAGQFNTLAALVTKAGLVDALTKPGALTVFAPTDEAFAKVPAATLEALGNDPAKLKAVLLYHVAKGNLTARKVVKRKAIKTLNGQKVKVRVRKGKVYVGGAQVIKADVLATNGVIHVINKVLIPKS